MFSSPRWIFFVPVWPLGYIFGELESVDILAVLNEMAGGSGRWGDVEYQLKSYLLTEVLSLKIGGRTSHLTNTSNASLSPDVSRWPVNNERLCTVLVILAMDHTLSSGCCHIGNTWNSNISFTWTKKFLNENMYMHLKYLFLFEGKIFNL